MQNPTEFGCKKCGAVVVVEVKVWGDHVDIRVKDGKFYDHFGKVEVQCKQCSHAVAGLGVGAAK